MRKKAIIVDIDGTLADISLRKKHLEGTKDWDRFHRELDSDTLNVWCREIMLRLRDEFDILLVTGRTETYRDLTVLWLEKNRVPFTKLWMRPENDFRKDDVVKKEIYERDIRKAYDVLFVIEDRARVVKMWRSIGLVCLQCDEGDF